MLGRLDVEFGDGINCSSTSIRKGYKGDVTHSVIADQRDYEVRIKEEDRAIEALKSFVRKIWKIITDAEQFILEESLTFFFPVILRPCIDYIPKDITFINSEELHSKYPNITIHDRENAAVHEYGAVFITGMGWPMADRSEEVRAPAYDDWNMNGDIIL